MCISKDGMGHKRWCIPDMYLPEAWNRAIASHETVCFTNTCERDAKITFYILFEDDRPHITIKDILVKSMRSLHIRMDYPHMLKGAEIPVGVPYSIVIESIENVVVEYSRLNWIDGEATTFAVMGYFED